MAITWHADYAPLGAAVKAARKRRRWTQAALAEGTGLRTTRIVLLERAEGKMSALELIAIARALGDALVLPDPKLPPAPPPAVDPGEYYNLNRLFEDR